MSDNKGKQLKHGDHVMPDGRIHHVLEVQNGFIDVRDILSRFQKKTQEGIDRNQRVNDRREEIRNEE